MNKILLTYLVCFMGFSCNRQERPGLSYDPNSPVLSYGAEKLSRKLGELGFDMEAGQVDSLSPDICMVSAPSAADAAGMRILSAHLPGIENDGYKIVREEGKIYILGRSDRGCLYGMMDVIEQLNGAGNLSSIQERQINPAISFRAIKFNLPWSPYRPGPATEVHLETCRDLDYWESFLDMMVKNRFNALSLWNTHPFPYMIRSRNYPDATPFNDQELDEWQGFWRSLFKMAKNRGIETYMVNWNIVVSPEFASAYGAQVHFDKSELVKKYTREAVTQVINEYEDLTGLGVTLADWMGNWGEEKMTSSERESWIEETFVKGMAEADRKVKFIHRAVLAGDPMEMRGVIDRANLPDKTIVEVKFNWSHGHSTPLLSLTHSNDDGTIMRGFWDPAPDNYFIAWTIRNEDFFVLRWGDPEFIREHVKLNNHSYVDGYFVGSEGYIPAVDYSHIENHPHKTWEYAFQKQWLFYHLWGRLLYHPGETDAALALEFRRRYNIRDAGDLLKAWSLASKVPQAIASFYKSTWDFTLYSEGFLSPWATGFDDQKSPFISLEELIRHQTLDNRYLDIETYCSMKTEAVAVDENLMDPLELADLLEEQCQRALSIINNLSASEKEAGLQSELADIETWCSLGFYFADKLRAGVSAELFNLTGRSETKKEALVYLEDCIGHWKKVVELTADRYAPMPYVSMGHHEPKWPGFTSFHWAGFLKEVEADMDYVRQLGTTSGSPHLQSN